MAINQNHLFEDLGGVKCAVVEKNVAAARVDFLRQILEYNHYTVVVVPSPPPKATAPTPPAATPATPAAPASAASAPGAPAPRAASISPAPTAPDSPTAPAAAAPTTPSPAPAPETFTVGVTDVMFNAINAIFGRLLKAPGGHVVTLAYWQQKENQPNDEKPYFDKR